MEERDGLIWVLDLFEIGDEWDGLTKRLFGVFVRRFVVGFWGGFVVSKCAVRLGFGEVIYDI